ncbi:MAG: hypothetical protein HQL64_17305, partial [Magnetococcales bacterium]|nr:hypothetical protein [Magnetococcales bacterium]
SAGAVSVMTAFAGFGALRLAWSLMRAQVVGLIAELGALAVAAGRLAFTPIGAVLTAAGIAAYAFSKATESAVPPLLENAAALRKNREAAQEKIKTLVELKQTLESTKAGSKEHIEAEEKLASLLPEANLSLDAQGRIMAKVGDAAQDNAGKLDRFIGQLKIRDRFDLASQLETQAKALRETRKELDAFQESMAKRYGATGGTQSPAQKNWQQIDRLNGTLEKNKVTGSELRRTHEEVAASINKTMQEAKKAGLSVEALGEAMDGIHADPQTKEQIVTLFRAMTNDAGSATGKVVTLADSLKQFSIAISGPVAAAKKGLVDAIGAADLQLGKYNEALVLHRGKLKDAVDDETKSWKALVDAATSAFETTTIALDEQFARRRARFQSEVNLYQATEHKRSSFMIEQANQEAEARKFSQQAMLQATNTFVIEETNARLAAARHYQTEALSLSQKEYQTKIDNAKRLGLDATRIDEERLQSQRRILEKVESAYRQNIDKLIAEEMRHRDAARQLAEQRKDFNASVADRIQGIAEKGMDPVQLYASRQRRIAQEQTQAEAALREGNFEAARKHADKMIALAEQTSEAVRVGNQEVVGANDAATRSIAQMQKATQIENQAFQEESNAHQAAADSLQKKSAAATDALTRVRQAVQEVDDALARDHTLLINANIEKIRVAGTEIDALLEKKERVVQIKAELQGGANALDTVVGNVLQGATGKVQASLDEVSRVFAKFKTELSGWQPEVKASFDTVSATGAIDGLLAKFQEFKTTVASSPVQVQAETGQALSAIEAVRSSVASLQDKTITINVVRQETEAHSQGGLAGFARGGFLPGWGGGDKIRALLEAGEFVLNRHAVRLYGLDRLYAMNRMKLNPADLPRFAQGGLVSSFRMPAIPRFEFGGVVRRLVIPTIPQVALAGGGAVTPSVEGVVNLNLTVNNRPEASLRGDRENVRRFVNALQEMQRGMR